MSKRVFLLFGITMLFFFACKMEKQGMSGEEDIIATVGGRVLLAAELDNIIHPAINKKDSTSLANSYIDQWVHDQLMMQEASKYFSSDSEIDKLVADYRQKLIKFNLEEKIINERFDTTVTQKELEIFYDKNKERFVLNQPLFRCNFAKLPDTAKKLDEFYRNWRKNDSLAVHTYLSKNALDRALDEKRWYTWPQIEEWSEDFSLNMAKNQSDQHISKGDYEYFLKVKEYRAENEISPLPFIKNQMIQMILHKRKQDIIEEFKKELYNRALETNQIKIK